MQVGRGGMGSHKHGISGYPTKSPRMRLWERMEAEKQVRKRRCLPLTASTMEELFRELGRKR